jgi:hypothetical protein
MLIKTLAASDYTKDLKAMVSNPQLSQIVTQHLIVLAFAETEIELELIINEYFEQTSPPVAQNFVKNSLSKLFRSKKISEISRFLKTLDMSFKENFDQFTKNHMEDATAYDNLITNRHKIAHEATCNITFEEFQKTIPAIMNVCNAVRAALNI